MPAGRPGTRSLRSACNCRVCCDRVYRGWPVLSIFQARIRRRALMPGPAAVRFDNVSKSYAVYAKPSDRLRELITFGRRRCHQDFWALRDVNLDIERGTTFSILGENGAGKSTLLQL